MELSRKRKFKTTKVSHKKTSNFELMKKTYCWLCKSALEDQQHLMQCEILKNSIPDSPGRVRVFGLSSSQFSSVQGTSYLSSVKVSLMLILFVTHQLSSVQSPQVILSQFSSIQFSSYLFLSQLSLGQFDSRNDLCHFS